MPQEEKLSAVVSTAASDIGSFIKAQREAAQVSVRQLAEKAGVSNPYLSQIERGLRKPSADVLKQIAKALQTAPAVLGPYAQQLSQAKDDEELSAMIERLRRTDPEFETTIVPRFQGM